MGTGRGRCSQAWPINRKNRRLTSSTQTGIGEPKWDMATWDEWQWGSQLVITDDDGGERPLATVLQRVMEMWERLLEQWACEAH